VYGAAYIESFELYINLAAHAIKAFKINLEKGNYK
jgi:hypothetical protein